MKTIGLCMIVKNEAPVILRCLASVRPLLDYALIEDTGSTDGTQEIIRGYLEREGLAGEVYNKPWSDFATNRSSALAALRKRLNIDYALIMDADDVLEIAPDFDVRSFKLNLSADLYHFWCRLGPVTYHRPQLCRNALPFYYRGVLHEFLEAPPQCTAVDVSGLTIVCGTDGSRSQAAEKYIRDADLLERALATETDPLLISRYTFYLAQSFRDHGNLDQALAHYLQRAELGFWEEERFISLHEAAKLKALLGLPDSEVVGLFLAAYELCPGRAESLHGAMRFCRNRGKYHQGYLIGKHAITLSRPAAGLFLEEWIYQYGLFDEFAVLAFWSGHYDDCRDYAARLLREGQLPAMERPRVAANLEFAQQQITRSALHVITAA